MVNTADDTDTKKRVGGQACFEFVLFLFDESLPFLDESYDRGCSTEDDFEEETGDLQLAFGILHGEGAANCGGGHAGDGFGVAVGTVESLDEEAVRNFLVGGVVGGWVRIDP